MATALQQQSDNSAEARRDALKQFEALPLEKQTAFLQYTYEKPELRNNPDQLHAAILSTVQNHIQGQHKLEMEALLQLSPQLVPAGQEQEAALKNLVAQTAMGKAEVEQALLRGEGKAQIETRAKGQGVVMQAIVSETFRENEEGKNLSELKLADDVYREKTGIAAQGEENAPHPMAHLLSGDLRAAIGAAMGGAQQAHNGEVSVAAGGKNTNQRNTSIV